jgi:signal transduction histidine kinase
MNARMPAARYFRDAAVFAPCYLVLDWASYIDPLGPFNITPWNPQAALAIAWMLLGGLQHMPVLLATVFAADVLVRDLPGGYFIALLTAATLAGGYAAIAWMLRAVLPDAVTLRTARELTVFTVVVTAGTAIIGAAFVGALRGAELLAEVPVAGAWLRFWIGDAVGILVTAPLLFAAVDAERRAGLRLLVRRPETLLQLALLVATVWLVFGLLPGDPSGHFYLFFVPLIWIAARGGLTAAVVATAVVQIGVVMGIHRAGVAELHVLELQALVAALTLTGLYLGMMVDERQRATEGLRHTLRLAAAGEMAGAIAHELNQPLTALTNYAQAAKALLGRGGEQAHILEVIDRMLAEGQRAAEVVRRLRDFFRAGTTRLELVELQDLLTTARRIGEQLIGARAIALDLRAAPDAPPLFIDRLQIELVLRNLIANAIDSLAASGAPGARIEIVAQPHDAGYVCLAVRDNGPGIPPARRETLFEPFVSGRPSGMGLGLAVSRAIAEAHGGSLRAHGMDHGEFHLILPCAQAS